jgi:hypothetical protein
MINLLLAVSLAASAQESAPELASNVFGGMLAREKSRREEAEDQSLEKLRRKRYEELAAKCKAAIPREKAVYQDLKAQKLEQAARAVDGLVQTLKDFRAGFSAGEIRTIKEAALERKKLAAADARDGQAYPAWGEVIEKTVTPRYRAFAPSRKTAVCADGSTVGSYRGEDSESDAFFPPSPACARAQSVFSVIWWSDASGVHAAACSGPVKRWESDPEYWFEHPACEIMNLLDGSLSSGPAPERLLANADRIPERKNSRTVGFPSEKDFVEGELNAANLRDCKPFLD